MAQEIDGESVRRLLKERGWTREELAAKVPIGREQVSRWITGKSNASDEAVARLAKIFDVPERMLTIPAGSEGDFQRLTNIWKLLPAAKRSELVGLAKGILLSLDLEDVDQSELEGI